MTSDCIVCQCRSIICLSNDFSIWYKSELDQSLESVTDTKCKSVSLIQKFFNSFFDLRILECSCKEFSWTIRLITGTESTWEHDHLSLSDCFLKLVYWSTDVFCIKVTEYFCNNLSACSLKCTGTVILTVRSREYRNKYCWLSDLMAANMNIGCIKELLFNLGIRICCWFCSKYFLKCSCPCILCVCKCDLHITVSKYRLFCYFTDFCISNCEFSNLSVFNLCDNISKCRSKQISLIYIVLDFGTHTVTKCHLADCCCNSMTIQCICRYNFSALDIFHEFTVLIHYSIVNRKIILVSFDLEPYKFVSCFLKFRCNNILLKSHINSKGYKCRRYVNILECSWHTVFSSDRRKSETNLCCISTKKCCKWLAPSLWILCHSTEILLECEADLSIISTCCHNLGNWLCHCINSSVVWAPAWQIWIKSITHHRNTVCCSVQNRYFRYHCLCLCHLVFSTMWHKYGTCSDRTVEHLNKSFLRAYIEIRKHRKPCLFYISYFFLYKKAVLLRRNLNLNICFLVSTICIKECTGKIDDLFSSPYKNESWLLCYYCCNCCL